MNFSSSTVAGVGIGMAFELAMHIFVHYTVPGAGFAASIAQTLSPVFNSVGIQTALSASPAVAALPTLSV